MTFFRCLISCVRFFSWRELHVFSADLDRDTFFPFLTKLTGKLRRTKFRRRFIKAKKMLTSSFHPPSTAFLLSTFQFERYDANFTVQSHILISEILSLLFLLFISPSRCLTCHYIMWTLSRMLPSRIENTIEWGWK